jgi:hypothetical protein
MDRNLQAMLCFAVFVDGTLLSTTAYDTIHTDKISTQSCNEDGHQCLMLPSPIIAKCDASRPFPP